MAKKETPATVDKRITVSHCNIGGVSEHTAETVSKLADVLIANADAVKLLANSIKSEFDTGLYIGQAHD